MVQVPYLWCMLIYIFTTQRILCNQRHKSVVKRHVDGFLKLRGYAEFIDLSGFLQPHSHHKSAIEKVGGGTDGNNEKLPTKEGAQAKIVRRG